MSWSPVSVSVVACRSMRCWAAFTTDNWSTGATRGRCSVRDWGDQGRGRVRQRLSWVPVSSSLPPSAAGRGVGWSRLIPDGGCTASPRPPSSPVSKPNGYACMKRTGCYDPERTTGEGHVVTARLIWTGYARVDDLLRARFNLAGVAMVLPLQDENTGLCNYLSRGHTENGAS